MQCFLLFLMVSRTNWNKEVQKQSFISPHLKKNKNEDIEQFNYQNEQFLVSLEMQANVARDRIERWGGDIAVKRDNEERTTY